MDVREGERGQERKDGGKFRGERRDRIEWERGGKDIGVRKRSQEEIKNKGKLKTKAVSCCWSKVKPEY